MKSQQRDAIALAINRNLHEAGESVNLQYPVIRALAWRVVAELIRRHPDKLRVIETHPGGGQYDCVTVMSRDRDNSLIVYLNMVGHLTHGAWFKDSGSTSGPTDARFNWLDVLGAEDLRQDIVEPLESSCQRSSKFPQLWSLKIPHLLGFSGRLLGTDEPGLELVLEPV